ncbi:hypothetical protein ACRAWD_05760 [Caulobacter segnis]
MKYQMTRGRLLATSMIVGVATLAGFAANAQTTALGAGRSTGRPEQRGRRRRRHRLAAAPHRHRHPLARSRSRPTNS